MEYRGVANRTVNLTALEEVIKDEYEQATDPGTSSEITTGTETEIRTWAPDTLKTAIDALAGAASHPVVDTTSLVEDGVDPTKEMRIDVGAVSTGTVRVISMGDRDVDLAAGGTFIEASGTPANNQIAVWTSSSEIEGASNLSTDSSGYLSIDNGVLYIAEQAAASTDFSGVGQLWVKSDTPNTFWFTDDAGTDGQVTIAGGAFHDGFSDFVANEHIDHTSVTLTAGTGLSGGGDISTNRTFNLAANVDDLQDVGTVAYTAGSILVGDGDSYEEVAVSGDATLSSAGVLDVTYFRIDEALNNTVIGEGAGAAVPTGDRNTIIGRDAGAAITTGSQNTCVGDIAGNSITIGTLNTLLGLNAGNKITSGSNNFCLGSSGVALTTGSSNVCIGIFNGNALTTQSNNIFIGQNTGETVTAASNTAVGVASMSGPVGSSGIKNCVFGYNSMRAASGAQYNVIMGADSSTVCTGNGNVFLGYAVGTTATSANNNVLIGRQVELQTVTDDSKLIIGNLIFGDTLTTGTTVSTGSVGIGVASPTATLHVEGPVRVKTYTVATLPAAGTVGAGAIAYVTDDATVGTTICWSDGSGWERPNAVGAVS